MSIKDIYRSLLLHKWRIGFVDDSLESIMGGTIKHVQYVKHAYNNRWWADPFILDYNENIITLLAEEYCDDDKKGKISKLIIDRKTMKLESAKIILELDSHLSFPAILKKEKNKVLIYPENNEGKGLVLYEYDLETDVCQVVKVLSKERFTDAIITNHFGKQLIFSTKQPDPNGKTLNIYSYNEEKVIFEFTNSIEFEEKIARNAGNFFVYNGQLFRFAQECNYIYGHALSLQKIENNNNNYFSTEVCRISSPKEFGNIGIHTFNIYKDLKVIDVKTFRHPWIAIPLFKLRNLFYHSTTVR